jgi:peptidoglycan hydrolase CwlO-like protein
MVDKKLVALSLICVVLCVAFVEAVLAVNQKDNELQMNADQISGLENEKTSLEAQVAGLQSEITALNSEKASLESQVSTLQTSIASLQTEIASLESEKNTLELQISALQTNISDRQSEIGSLNDDKATLEAQVVSLESEITALSSEKASLESQVSTLQTDIATLQTEIESLEGEVIESFNSGYDEGETEGYERGYDEGYEQGIEERVGDGWYISRDPTLGEALVFINLDTTDENEYTEDYVCYDFTADFNSNAFQMGYRCGFVYIEFDESAHAIACFNTTDSGLIYVEPQTDEIVNIAVGQEYINHVIVRIGIIW